MSDLFDLQLFQARREHALFERLRAKPAPHWSLAPDGGGFWSVTRHDQLLAAARDHRRLTSGKGTQIRDKRAEGDGHPSVHNADPPLHGRLRAPALKALSKSAMARHEARIRATIAGLIEAAPRGTGFDFVERVAARIPMIVFADVLGVPAGDAGQLADWANTMSDIGAPDADQAASRARLFAYFRDLAEGKRVEPGDDVASDLAAAFDGPERDHILDAYFMLLTVAGNETTRFLLAEGLEALATTPGALARLRAAPELVPAAVEEMCRWVSPVIHMRRTAAADFDLFGAPVRAGDRVVLWFAAANRDPAAFGEADRFDIGRAPNPHVGFGAGAHFCLGAHLARLEARIFLEEMLDRIARIDIEAPAERHPSNWFAATARLPVRWQ